MPSAEFQKLYDGLKTTLAKEPSQDEQLDLYAYAKIAMGEEAKKPSGMMDFTTKYKYNAWDKRVKEGVSQEEAEKKYIELAKQLYAKYGTKTKQ